MSKSQGFVNKEMLIDEINNLHNYFSKKCFTNADATIICHQFMLVVMTIFEEKHK